MENPTRIAEPAVLLANDYPCLLLIVCAVYRDMPEKYEHLNSIVFAVTHYGRDLPQFTKQAYAVTWQQMRSNAERFQDYILKRIQVFDTVFANANGSKTRWHLQDEIWT